MVTVVLADNGGTDNGGNDRTAPVEFTITVNELNDNCPEPDDQMVATLEDTPVAITLTATDIDNESGCGAAPLSYWVMLPQHGWLMGSPPNLVYTPDPGYCGADSFIFLVEDTACFAVATVSIEVNPLNDCPIALPQSVSTCEDTAVDIILTGSDPDELSCGPTIQGFAIAQPPAHGTLSGTPPTVSYMPEADYNGMDSFTFTATDGECVSEPATVSILVKPGNDGPNCQIVVGPRLQVTPDVTENIVVSCDNLIAEVVLDATLSGDPENDSLTYLWLVDGRPVGNDAIVTAVLELGTHEVTLTVDDGNAGAGECPGGASSSTCTTMVTVIDGCEAVEELVLLVEQNSAAIGDSLRKTLNKELKDACKKFAKGKCKDGVKELEQFQDTVMRYDPENVRPSKKLSAKKRIDHETAVLLIDAAQEVIDAFESCDCMKNK
jgi:hypothetical protein